MIENGSRLESLGKSGMSTYLKWNEDQWLDVARTLPLGGKVRIAHHCATTKDMIVSNSPQGLSAYCFRCGPVGYRPHGKQTLQERTELIERTRKYERELAAQPRPKLPDDYSIDIPPQFTGWLDKAGITERLRRQYRIGWSHSLHRIIVPVYSRDGDLSYWQGRAVLPVKPKYINPKVNKDGLCFWAGDHKQRDVIVITEDILSAIRVSESLPAASLLGCKVSDRQALDIGEYRRVFIWLDPDSAGIKGAREARRKLNLLTDTSIIQSYLDPKELSRREIADILDVPFSQPYTVDEG